MAITYEPIATTTLSSAAATVTFSSISGSYTDLVLITTGTQDTDDTCGIRFNADSGANYSATRMSGNGTAVSSSRWTDITSAYFAVRYTTQNNAILQIQNYSNNNTYKTFLSRANNAGNLVNAWVGLWRNTAAITSITLTGFGSSNFASGSTFTLYGIKAA